MSRGDVEALRRLFVKSLRRGVVEALRRVDVCYWHDMKTKCPCLSQMTIWIIRRDATSYVSAGCCLFSQEIVMGDA